MQSTVDYNKTTITFRCYGANSKGVFYDDDGISFGYETGDFAEWWLQAENGKLKAERKDGQFANKERQYQIQYQDKVSTVQLV